MDRGNDFHYVVPYLEMHEFIVNCVKAAGCVPEQADSVGRMLLDADSRGHYSHGVNRLNVYIRDLQTNTCKPDGKPKVTKKKGSTALVDGDNALGSVVGEFCMNLAIDLAKEHGIGWVAAHNSNHFGTAGRYAKMASDIGFIGMAFTNTSPCLFPTRSAQKALGTNPISFFAPTNNGDTFSLDMATSTVAYGKVEFAKRKGKDHVPIGWGADRNGVMTTNPDEILNEGGLLPLGGIEESSGYKGTGLCQMVEILCGILSGASFGKNIRQWLGVAKHADLGQCFVVVDPECFASGFGEKLQQFLDENRELKPVDPQKRVIVAGDLSRQHLARSKSEGGLLYHKNQIESLKQIAKTIGVELFSFKEYIQH